jgi:hypothetical protein
MNFLFVNFYSFHSAELSFVEMSWNGSQLNKRLMTLQLPRRGDASEPGLNKLFLSQESLRMVYFSYFHSKMTWGLVFWGNSYHSNTVFKVQKRIIRIMVGIRDSHAENISGN